MREKDSRPRVDSGSEDEPDLKKSRLNDDEQPTICPNDGDQPLTKCPDNKDRIACSNGDDQPQIGLLALSDDILLHLLSYLNTEDLLALGECNDRLRHVVNDKVLWRTCDLRPRVIESQTLRAIVSGLKPVTTLFATCGPISQGTDQTGLTGAEDQEEGSAVKQPTWPLDFMLALSKHAPNLKTLIIESHVVDCTSVHIEHFPKSVETLSLRNCNFINVPTQESYFMNVHSSLTRLKSLDLTNCSWFSSHSLLALSKCFRLEELVLSGCEMYQCMPYASLAANYGFMNLRLLDLRNTAVGDSDVACFNRMDNLRHLLLSPLSMANRTSGDNQRCSCNVTDFSVLTFGSSRLIRRQVVVHVGVLWPERDTDRLPCQLESLVLNNYPGITDLSLEHISLAMPELKLLDVTGTNVTNLGVTQFRAARPEVNLVSSRGSSIQSEDENSQ